MEDHAGEGATVYTDDASACETRKFDYDSVRHLLEEYVTGELHTNRVQSL